MKLFTLPGILFFDWDKGNLEHIKKHAVEYSQTEEVFYDHPIFFEDQKHSKVERRFLVYGTTTETRYLTLVFTLRKTTVRVISARDQSKNERKAYQRYIRQLS